MEIYIRRGEEGVRASDLGPSENQATLQRNPVEAPKNFFFGLLNFAIAEIAIHCGCHIFISFVFS